MRPVCDLRWNWLQTCWLRPRLHVRQLANGLIQRRPGSHKASVAVDCADGPAREAGQFRFEFARNLQVHRVSVGGIPEPVNLGRWNA
jgi:hypothetical protein